MEMALVSVKILTKGSLNNIHFHYTYNRTSNNRIEFISKKVSVIALISGSGGHLLDLKRSRPLFSLLLDFPPQNKDGL